MEVHAAVLIDPELVPAHTAAAGPRVDRMDGDDRFVTTRVPVDEPLHDLVALRIEAPVGSRLGDAIGKLPAA